MKPPSKQMLKRLAAAVEWRSHAVGWHAIARQLGTRPEVCKRWPGRYPDAWSQLWRAAQVRRYEELERDVSIALDGLLHNPDAKVRERAERMVAKYRMRKEPVEGSDGRVVEVWRKG